MDKIFEFSEEGFKVATSEVSEFCLAERACFSNIATKPGGIQLNDRAEVIHPPVTITSPYVLKYWKVPVPHLLSLIFRLEEIIGSLYYKDIQYIHIFNTYIPILYV